MTCPEVMSLLEWRGIVSKPWDCCTPNMESSDASESTCYDGHLLISTKIINADKNAG